MSGGDFEYSNIDKLIIYIVNNTNSFISKTKLFKLCYLVDLHFKRSKGNTLTGIKYISYHYGPFSEDISNSINRLKGFEIMEHQVPANFKVYEYTPGRFIRGDDKFSPNITNAIKNILRKYSNLDLDILLKVVYNTKEYKDSNFGETILVNDSIQ